MNTCRNSHVHTMLFSNRLGQVCHIVAIIFLQALVVSCSINSEVKKPTSSKITTIPLFRKLDTARTKIKFGNFLKPETEALFVKEYRYMFNGGGVGLGDINNDGLIDVFLTGNEVGNRLYLNLGDFSFKDISIASGINHEKGWFTGVTMADINADGLLDIYLCRSFDTNSDLRRNIAYINNGDATFTNRAIDLRIADNGFSTQAAFFDYNMDGLLDLYVLNHPDKWFMKLPLSYPNNEHTSSNQDRLYKNNGNGTFKEVSKSAGLVSESFGGYGLGLSISDIDLDNDPDIYVSNDYESPDYFYINNGDGTFKESFKQRFGHSSMYSMGCDIADYNNDGYPDICVLDMAAEDHYRSKTQMRAMNPDKFHKLIGQGLPHQYMYNTLQLNNRNGIFSDVAQIAGVSSTDWSWGPLFADFDGDGYKDLFITNGFRVDDMDNDYWINAQRKYGEMLLKPKSLELSSQMLSEMGVTPLSNYAFRNDGHYKFENTSHKWGLNEKGFSQGASYADLDNDGDLDLVVNNLGDLASIYENRLTNQYPERRSIKVRLKYNNHNTFGVGARVYFKTNLILQLQELFPTRGFQSCTPHELLFSMSDGEKLESIKVLWPDGKEAEIAGSKIEGDIITVDYNDRITLKANLTETKEKPLFEEKNPKGLGITHRHQENKYNDYRDEVLLPYKYSMLGTKMCVGDVNNDGLDDFYVGGAIDQEGALYLQLSSGKFKRTKQNWKSDKVYEDINAVFFDFDNDNDLDLYVVSGGNEYGKGGRLLNDRLYRNNGMGKFSRHDALPDLPISGGVAVPADIDNDGDMDLFVGGRQIPGQYGYPASSKILINDNGKYQDMTNIWNSSFDTLGMVTDAAWKDLDNDGDQDLMVVGEWMKVSIFINNNGRLKIFENQVFDELFGWWNSISMADYDEDGDIDFVLGNLGENQKYKASLGTPFHLFTGDFDRNGKHDIVLSYTKNKSMLPQRGRECSTEQIPGLANKVRSYKAFGSATLGEIYGDALIHARHLFANTFSTVYLENLGNLQFSARRLNIEAQFSCVNGIISKDFNGDGHVDLGLSGNLFQMEVETPRNDGSIGCILLGDGSGKFTYLPPDVSGYLTNHDVKDIQWLKRGALSPLILVSNNNDQIQVFECRGTIN